MHRCLPYIALDVMPIPRARIIQGNSTASLDPPKEVTLDAQHIYSNIQVHGYVGPVAMAGGYERHERGAGVL